MPLYKIIKAFCVPPGMFVTAFLLVAILLSFNAYCCRKYSKKLFLVTTAMSIFCYLFAGAAYGLSINAGASRLISPLEYKYERVVIKPDAIFVLGGGQDTSRELTGAALQKKYGVDVYVSGHNGEAESMRKLMLAKGVKEETIKLEPKASNTKEHVKYLLPMVIDKGYRKIYLVTSAYHMPRSMLLFAKPFKNYGIDIIPYPCDYRTGRKHVVSKEKEWLPNMHSFWRGYEVWTEYLGMLEIYLGII